MCGRGAGQRIWRTPTLRQHARRTSGRQSRSRFIREDRAMTIDRDAAAVRVAKVFERLEGAPLAPAPIEPPAAPAAAFKQRQPDPDPTPARPNAYQHRDACLHALMGAL